jgi:hypothetical protein
MSTKTILISTDAAGAFSYERPFFGLIEAAQFQIGDLDTATMLITVSDAVRDYQFIQLGFGEILADAYYQPVQPFPVYGTLLVTVVNGGDTKHASVRMMTQT